MENKEEIDELLIKPLGIIEMEDWVENNIEDYEDGYKVDLEEDKIEYKALKEKKEKLENINKVLKELQLQKISIYIEEHIKYTQNKIQEIENSYPEEDYKEWIYNYGGDIEGVKVSKKNKNQKKEKEIYESMYYKCEDNPNKMPQAKDYEKYEDYYIAVGEWIKESFKRLNEDNKVKYAGTTRKLYIIVGDHTLELFRKGDELETDFRLAFDFDYPDLEEISKMDINSFKRIKCLQTILDDKANNVELVYLPNLQPDTILLVMHDEDLYTSFTKGYKNNPYANVDNIKKMIEDNLKFIEENKN